ncbi:MAG: hypothetical protein LH654_06535, partial [Thermoleophilia bacterium]|nr:hypothetical protein [Thermoleophilia bacterium]
LGVALATAVVGWSVAIGLLALLPLTAAVVMRRGLPEPNLPPHGGGWRRHLTNVRLLGVSMGGAALFFTFVGSFTFIIYRLEEPPFSLSLAAASLVFLLWLTGLAGPLAGRLADRVGWRRLALGTVGLSATGLLLTLPDVLPLLVIGLACIAGAMFTGYTATQLGVSDVARIDRGAATALYFGIYYAGGALGAYVPGLAWQEWGWGGVAATGFVALALAAAGIASVRSMVEIELPSHEPDALPPLG